MAITSGAGRIKGREEKQKPSSGASAPGKGLKEGKETPELKENKR